MTTPGWEPACPPADNPSPLRLLELDALPEPARRVIAALRDAGGRPMLVGGQVRDALRGEPPTDVDIEVYHLGRDEITAALEPLGRVDLVGRSFGVIKVWPGDGEADIDVSAPRTENKTGRGIRGFQMEFPTDITAREAASRRDYTINAMAFDPVTGELFDFFGGRADLAAGVLRHVGPKFAEDPERVRRGMQFAARFELTVAPATAALCRELLAEADTSPASRIWGEWAKWADRGVRPGLGLRFLADTGWLDTLPELAACRGCPQDPEWHPEGDVFTHTALVCDQAAAIAAREQLDVAARRVLVFAALCHDLGKPETTVREGGRLRSPRHDKVGVPLTRALLERIGAPNALFTPVERLVRWHMVHLMERPTTATWRRHVLKLSERLKPASIELWRQLVQADASGRHPAPPSDPGAPWLERAREHGCATSPPASILQGRDLLALGMPPGPAVGLVLRRARDAQLADQFRDRDGALRWLGRNAPEIRLLRGQDLLDLGVEPGPHLGRVLNDALRLQLAGELATRDEALAYARDALGD